MDEDIVIVEHSEVSVVAVSEEHTVTVVVVEPAIITDEMLSCVVVEVESTAVVAVGQQGPPGPRGTDGLSGAGYEYSQPSASSLWVVNHNLGFRPTVCVFDSAGWEVDADVQHMSLNQTTIAFSTPLAGTARLI